jgi:hypothetical protein
MRLGILEIHRLRRHPVSGRRDLPWGILQQGLSPVTQAVIAKCARSEVKNYLAALAEQAEMPFGDPGGFLAALRDLVQLTGTIMDTTHPAFDAEEAQRASRQAGYLARLRLARDKGMAPCNCPDCPDDSGDCPHGRTCRHVGELHDGPAIHCQRPNCTDARHPECVTPCDGRP